jgi:hypothetical protein
MGSITWDDQPERKGMGPEEHMNKAESLLAKGALVLTQAYSEITVEKVQAYARLADVHIKAAQILKDW